jgi:PAS domain S-box-containing protein
MRVPVLKARALVWHYAAKLSNITAVKSAWNRQVKDKAVSSGLNYHLLPLPKRRANNMKVFKCLLVFLLLIKFGYADDKVLIVGSEQNYPPFALGLTDDAADGFTVELWRAVAAESHLQSTIQVKPFHEILQDFKAGKIDVLINLAQSEERRQFSDFTVPHVIVNGAIFVRQGENSIHSETDLDSKQIIVLNADLAHDYAVSKGWGKQLVLVDTSEQGFELLASGQYDVFLLSKLAGQQTLEKLGLKTIEALPIKAGFAQKFSFAVHKGDAELLAKINEGLALTKSSGVYDKLYEKWFGVYEEEDLLPLLIKYLVPIISIFVLIIAIGFYRRSIERKQAIQALQESESRFRDLFENAPLPYQSLDINGRLLFVNEACLTLFGCRREQVIGQFFTDFVTDKSKALLSEILIQFKNNHAGHSELELMCSIPIEKHIVTITWQIAKDSHQQFQRAHCILNDITERHHAEQALKTSEQRFKLLADYAPVFIWLTDENGLCSYVNRVWLDFIGSTAAMEHEQHGTNWLNNIHKDDYQACFDRYMIAFNKRQPFQINYRLRRYDGVYRWILDTGVPRFSEDKQFVGYIGSCVDITERYQAEQLLKEHQSELVQFTHIAAHHLQEPNRRLVTFVQRLHTELAQMPMLSEDVMVSLNFIEQSALRQRALVRDIQLYLAAIRPTGVVECNSVMKTLAKVLRHHAQLIRETEAQINYPELPPVHLDQSRLYDIFNILLDNALKYRHPERTLQIQISAESKNGRVYYRVTDNGIGIPADCHERVFLVFERLQVNGNPESTGIGLAIVQRIIKSCHGTISLHETPNGGTTVLFDLPE